MGMYSTDFIAGTIRDGERVEIFFYCIKKKKEKWWGTMSDHFFKFFLYNEIKKNFLS